VAGAIATGGTAVANAASFDLAAAGRAMRSELDGRAVGWTFAASANGRTISDAQGLSRTIADFPLTFASATARVNVAEATRTVTAVAALQALAGRGLAVTAKIAPFLPADWGKGPGIATLTFRDLLTHHSGFRAGAETYPALKAAVATGIRTGDKVFSYDHTNFALFRVLVPYLDGYTGAGDKDAATSTAFLAFLNSRVFAPAGIPTVTAAASGFAPGLTYPNPAGLTPGVSFGDWTRRTGSRGLHLSVTELATFATALRTSTSLLSAAQRDALIAGNYGLSPHDYPVEHGTFDFGGGELRAATPGGLAMQTTYLCSFSSGLQLAVTTHSLNDDGMGLFLKAIEAEFAGWV
jgi:hypothetical protein